MNKPGCYETKGKQAMLFGNPTIGGILPVTALERMLLEKLWGN